MQVKKKPWCIIFDLSQHSCAYEKTKLRTTQKLFDYLHTYTIKAGKIAITKNSKLLKINSKKKKEFEMATNNN